MSDLISIVAAAQRRAAQNDAWEAACYQALTGHGMVAEMADARSSELRRRFQASGITPEVAVRMQLSREGWLLDSEIQGD